MIKPKFSVGILKCAGAMEFCIAAAILAAAAIGGVLLVWQAASTLSTVPAQFSIHDFLSKALLIVMGVEFVRMLVLHTPRAVIDVLLFAIARQMIVSHSSGGETLLGVAAVAGIFVIKKYLLTPEAGRGGNGRET